ncbi:hypothetical protein QQS21_009674 [Conoideocrella luteorostrata]|uniref:Uncharacterized protein n=1 Tax=Conoideocrella luteorostrata TaxID=1105319 RepID=A0AAJ0CJ63_9HYPO|nr:hypothetical protein QQS21_009674 [Conoideocrella luteorostrata]
MKTIARLSYMTWDAVFLCFDVKEKMGMFKVLLWWEQATNQGFYRDTPPLVYLLGMKKDLRLECSFEDHRRAMRGGSSFGSPSCCVNPSDADWHAKRIGAERYLECSALSGEGVESLFEEVGRKAVRRATGYVEGGLQEKKAARRKLVLG